MSDKVDFGAALAAMKAGKAVRRAAWGEGQAMSLTGGPAAKLVLAIPPPAPAAGQDEGAVQDGVQQVQTPRGTTMQVTTDTLLAEDWEVLG